MGKREREGERERGRSLKDFEIRDLRTTEGGRPQNLLAVDNEEALRSMTCAYQPLVPAVLEDPTQRVEHISNECTTSHFHGSRLNLVSRPRFMVPF